MLLGVLLGVLVAAAAVTVLGRVHRPASTRPVPAVGTVTSSQPCAQAGARDSVVFVVDGRSYQLPLDACGNPEGIRLDVEMITERDGTRAVRLAGAGASAPNAVIADRAGSLLLALAGVAGALLIVLVRTPLPSPAAISSRPRAATAPDAPATAAQSAAEPALSADTPPAVAPPAAPTRIAPAAAPAAARATPATGARATPARAARAAAPADQAPKTPQLTSPEQPVVS